MTTIELIASRLTDLATQIEDLAAERDAYREAAMRLRRELAEARKGRARYVLLEVGDTILPGDELFISGEIGKPFGWTSSPDLEGYIVMDTMNPFRRKVCPNDEPSYGDGGKE